MWISDISIRKPIAAIVAMLVLVLAGTLALRALKTDEFPDVAMPVVAVTLPYPGAAPGQVERDVLRPVEQKLAGLGGLKRLFGTAGDGYAAIFAEFVYAKAPAEAMQEVRDAVGAVRSELPREVREPVIERYSETDLPIQSVVLASSTEPPLALGERARRLARELRTIPGVAQVTVIGASVPELGVRLRPDAMRAAGVGMGDVVAALQAQNVSAPLGRLQGPAGEQSLRLAARPADASAFAALVIARGGAGVVRLGDVATVQEGVAERRSGASYDGTDAVSLDVRKARGASTTDVAARVRSRLDEARQALPAGTTLTVVQDAGLRTGRAVADVGKTLVEGAVLTVLVVFLFLNSWRSTVITGLALPVSVLASFIAVWLFGFKLETMSLLGLSLAIGLLVDDAIVVRENIVRHVEMGKDHRTAAREGTAEIGLAVLATTLAIVVVFVPVAFMDGVAGQWFKPFALTIACAVLVSLFVSFSLDPMLSAYWPDPHRAPGTGGPVTRALDRFNAWFDRLAHGYRGVVRWALAHRGATLGLALASLVAAAAIPAAGWVGTEFLPADDQSELRILVETPPGTPLAETMRRAEGMARLARAEPEVTGTYLTVGGQQGEVTDGSIVVRLRPRAERERSVREVLAVLRARAREVPGATFSFLESGVGSSGTKPLQVVLTGADGDVLPAAARGLAEAMGAIPGVVDVTLDARAGQPQLEVAPVRALGARLGLAPADLAEALQVAFAGLEVGEWIDPEGQGRKVVVRVEDHARREAADLERLPLLVPSPAGPSAAVALAQVATVTPGSGPARVQHRNGRAAVTIGAAVAGRPLGDVAAAVDSLVAATTLPPGVQVLQGGDVESQREVFGSIGLALAVALAGMYFVLVLQFESWVEPLAILASLPLSLVGVVGALWLTGDTLNLMSLIGVVLLAGLVAKNAILLLEFAKQLHEERGVPLGDALVEAGAVRLRPIVMTTLALVAGMVPVALGHGEGAQFRAPLGVAVIGGTLTSTLLTLVVIPSLYEAMREAAERATRVAGRLAGGASVRAAGGTA
ncbi:MAG: efflux RND transporter permease subunit [Gemmatimonadales bacterium]|nr:efflux RND transporter permease subunit [Gemmatimonadales bacterium]